MKCGKRDLLLYAVTDRSWSEGTTLGAQVEEALRGGHLSSYGKKS